MYSMTKDYGSGTYCHWPRDSFLYGGLCLYSPLREDVQPDLDLTKGQLEALAETARLRIIAYQPVRYNARRDAK